jgi:hypothetical protein
MNTNLTCRAASPDNDREIRDIIALFRAVHGDNYPFSGVYKSAYWKQHIGSRFVSIVLYQDEQLLGHIALQAEGADRRMIQVIFPLSAPDAVLSGDLINQRLWQQAEKLAQDQQWRGFYFSALTHIPELIPYGEQILKATPIALCPGYFAPSVTAKKNSTNIKLSSTQLSTDILISQRLFNPAAHKTQSIYISTERKELLEKLYQSLGLTREIRSKVSKEQLQSFPLAADRLAIETRLYPNAGVLHAYIEPSLLRSQQELRSLVDASHRANIFVFVKGYDPRALDSEEWLIENGFEFAGVLPFIHNRESLLFTKPRDNHSTHHMHAESVLMNGLLEK